MLNTIIRNLLSNAIKFNHKKGSIELDSINFGKFIQISIKDSGIGTPEDILSGLFKAGEKTSRRGTEGETSTGLGLILCKEYIDNHNGRIWVERIEGNGAIFYFTIPLTT